MSLHVNFFVFLAGEGPFADLADERLLAGVTAIMGGQRVLLLKCHRTPITLVGVVFDVTIVVVLQLHLVPERLVALGYGTSERSLGVVNGLYVLVEAPFFSELLVAVGAYLRHHVAMKP